MQNGCHLTGVFDTTLQALSTLVQWGSAVPAKSSVQLWSWSDFACLLYMLLSLNDSIMRLLWFSLFMGHGPGLRRVVYGTVKGLLQLAIICWFLFARSLPWTYALYSSHSYSHDSFCVKIHSICGIVAVHSPRKSLTFYDDDPSYKALLQNSSLIWRRWFIATLTSHSKFFRNSPNKFYRAAWRLHHSIASRLSVLNNWCSASCYTLYLGCR